jgi:hypothetical protein
MRYYAALTDLMISWAQGQLEDRGVRRRPPLACFSGEGYCRVDLGHSLFRKRSPRVELGKPTLHCWREGFVTLFEVVGQRRPKFRSPPSGSVERRLER